MNTATSANIDLPAADPVVDETVVAVTGVGLDNEDGLAAFSAIAEVQRKAKANGENAPLFYLATPYSLYPKGRTEAAKAAVDVLGALMAAGVNTFSPILHGHVARTRANGALDKLSLDAWLDIDAPYMRAAAALIVCKLDGWQNSAGIAREIATFEHAGKPVIFLPEPSLR